MKLAGRVAVVTGGASGIGLAAARLFAAEGAHVALVDRDAEALARAVGDIRGAMALPGDVGDEAMVARHAAALHERFGRWDVLLAAAGVSAGKSVADSTLDEWDFVLRTNLTGTFLWARAAVPVMAAGGGGSIILVGSQLATAGGRSNAAYIATKGAIASLARTMAVDHAAAGIRVNVVVPGAIDTPLLARAFRARTTPRRRASARSRAIRSAGSAAPRRSRARPCSSRATKARSPPARASSSTAAGSRAERHLSREHHMAEQPAAALAEDVRRQIMSVAVPTIVSILYRKGLRNTMMFAPKPLNPAAAKFVGTAFTVRTIPTREDLVEATGRGERPNLQAEATARAGAGDVLVVAMEGETRTAFMGDIMATHFLAKGVAGVVLDGGVSDAAALARIPFPVFCCGAAGTPVTSHRMVIELQAAIGCAGVAVFPGDVVFGDANGVVCIPRHLAAEVAETAAERERMEEWIIERVRDGRPLKGTYPPDEKTLAEYRAWQAAKAGSSAR